uniref:Uncharacterized protein n=1 Tax=Triticum urartu TaxID=4572 RepID=A0A8R7TCF3_TRIUA
MSQTILSMCILAGMLSVHELISQHVLSRKEKKEPFKFFFKKRRMTPGLYIWEMHTATLLIIHEDLTKYYNKMFESAILATYAVGPDQTPSTF